MTDSWGMSVEYFDSPVLSHNLIPVDDKEIHWELAHALHETDTLRDADDITAQFCSVLLEKDWTNSAAVGDAATVMRPYLRMIDEMFEIEDIDYTESVQARYFDQIAWMFLQTYARIDLQDPPSKET